MAAQYPTQIISRIINMVCLFLGGLLFYGGLRLFGGPVSNPADKSGGLLMTFAFVNINIWLLANSWPKWKRILFGRSSVQLTTAS
jgi:hypothetical protein